MASVTDYEEAYANLIKVFGKAMTAVMSGKDEGSRSTQRLVEQAFELAEKYGWDAAADEEWMHWALKATGPELLAHGLAKAIQKTRL